jgi:hypothetical protein
MGSVVLYAMEQPLESADHAVVASDSAPCLGSKAAQAVLREIPVAKASAPEPVEIPVASDISFSTWYRLCVNHARTQDTEEKTILDVDYFFNTRRAFIRACQAGVPQGWFELPEEKSFTDYFFVQKLCLKNGERAHTFGDIHGDADSLLAGLKNLRDAGELADDFSLAPEVYLIFLGDYIDRGDYSIEVLYTLFRLKIKNPIQVILLRGNHENGGMLTEYKQGTLVYECDKKILGSIAASSFSGAGAAYKGPWLEHMGLGEKSGAASSSGQLLYERYMCPFFNLMPVALYVGIPLPEKDVREGESPYRWILYCHGGPELGFFAKDFLASSNTCMRIDTLEVPKAIRTLADSATSEKERIRSERIQAAIRGVLAKENVQFKDVFRPRTSDSDAATDIGFLWNDFFDETDDKIFGYDKARGFVIGKKLLLALLKREGLLSVVRGHQHTGWLGEGLEELCGFCSLYGREGYAPRMYTIVSATVYFKSTPFDYSFLTLSQNEGNWQFEHKYKENHDD